MGLFSRRRGIRPTPGAIDFGWATNSGRRSDNQDRVAVTAAWAVLSDGVGGQPGGARAAELTVGAAAGYLDGVPPGEGALLRAFGHAGAAVRDGRRATPGLSRMDATLTVALAVSAEGRAIHWLVGWVGDSPAWVATASGVRCLTTAHTLAAVLGGGGPVRRGDAELDFGRNVLMRTVATEDDAGPDLVATVIGPGDGLILASDGLAEGVGADEMRRAWSTTDAAATAERLVASAVRGGASDNVTVAVLRHSGR